MNEVKADFGDGFIIIGTTDDARIIEQENPKGFTINCTLNTDGLRKITSQMVNHNHVTLDFPYGGKRRLGEFHISNIHNDRCQLLSSGKVD
ncbi:hypothetical protein [Paremcibacter congregatus]|uniref:hypothetical protein n=1 Tax=Paremcibacter congregatus TaxID=2043170 RepID=UPI003A941CA3